MPEHALLALRLKGIRLQAVEALELKVMSRHTVVVLLALLVLMHRLPKTVLMHRLPFIPRQGQRQRGRQKETERDRDTGNRPPILTAAQVRACRLAAEY